MKLLFALTLVVVACGGPAKKPEGAIVHETGSAAPETCCCKSFPPTSDDGKPAYAMAARMLCSTDHGECVDDVQCNASNTK